MGDGQVSTIESRNRNANGHECNCVWMGHMDRMIILHLWGMRERRILKRAREKIPNKAPREPIDANMRQNGGCPTLMESCEIVTEMM